MKITMKAILIDVSHEHKSILDNMMLIFCTAIRYSFKRLLEGAKINNLEKAVSAEYSLNIRQAKDAVESARQTIKSQRELVKLNYQNYCHKVKKIEKVLDDKDRKLSDKKKNALLSKLDKRKRRMEYFKGYMDSGTFPPVTFGTKKMFLKRCKGLINNKEWKHCRNNRIYSRGDKTKCGNPNLRVIIKNNMTFLEISTLEKTNSNRAIKIQVPIYLPQKLSKKTGRVNGINYRELFMDHLQWGEAYQVELIREDDKYYAHITFELPRSIPDTGHNGIIGVDTNPNGFALTMVDSHGNHKWHAYLKQHELVYARGNRRENLCGELAKQVILTAKTYNCGIAVEDMRFKDDTDVKSKLARVRHQFIYSKLLSMLERTAIREGIEIIKVKPQFTSKIGLYKYCHQYGMPVHNGAAMVIARRSFKLKEKVPRLLKDKLIKDIDGFDRKNEWSRWAVINKIINEKGVKSPGLWLKNRKQILGLAG